MSGESFFAAIAAVVALAASGTAIALGIDQLLSGARLRSLEALLREARGVSGGDAHQRVLASLHVTTVGRIVARQAVPARSFVFPAFLLTAVLVQLVLAWVQFSPGDSLWDPILKMVNAAVLGGSAVVMGSHLLRERARVAQCYARGVVPIRAYTSMLALMEGGTKSEFLRACVLALALSAGVSGASILATEVDVPSFVAPVLIFIAVPLIVWVGIAIRAQLARVSLEEPRNTDNSLKPTWVHPADNQNATPTV